MGFAPFSDEYFMNMALLEAQRAYDADEVPVGAVIVCKNHVIARAHNLSVQLNDPTAHAEMQAFTAATSYLSGKSLMNCTLFVTLEPCVMCTGASYWVQIGRIVFGAYDQKRGGHSINKQLLHPKTEVTGGVLEDDCEKLLKMFFLSKRNNSALN